MTAAYAYYRAPLTGSSASTRDGIRPNLPPLTGTLDTKWAKDGTVLGLVAVDDAAHTLLTNTPGVHRCTSRDCTLACAKTLGAAGGWQPEGYSVGGGA